MSDSGKKQHRRQWVQTGIGQGAKWGGILAIGYMLLPLAVTIVAVIWQLILDIESVASGGESRLLEEPIALVGALFAAIFFSIFYFMFGSALGVLPAIVIGALSGGVLGGVLSLPHIAPYRWNRLAVGVGVAVVMAVGINQLGMALFAEQAGPDMELYLFFIGAPSLAYLGFCVWLSHRLPHLIPKPREGAATQRSYPPLTEE